MSLRDAVRTGLRWTAVLSGFGLLAHAGAQEPPSIPPIIPVTFPPPTVATQTTTSSATVEGSSKSVDGTASFTKAMTTARSKLAGVRDYTCYLVRQERVAGVLLPEQTGELRFRAQPLSVSVKLTGPQEYSGQETCYASRRFSNKVRFHAAGAEGIRTGYQTRPLDDPKILATTRHPITSVGMTAVLDRIEQAIKMEKQLNHPVQILTASYTFAKRPVTRFEIFADRTHPARYARRMVLYIDDQTHLPVRFEAYDQPKADRVEGELLEVVSFLNTKTNVGLGEAVFER